MINDEELVKEIKKLDGNLKIPIFINGLVQIMPNLLKIQTLLKMKTLIIQI